MENSQTPKGCSKGEQHLEVLFKTHEFFSSEASFYSYRGTMLEQFTEAIMDLGELVKKGNGDEKMTIKKRAPYLMVECFQNIVRHGVQDPLGEARGYFGFYSSSSYFTINTINGISESSVSNLRQLLDEINASSDEEKKAKYLEIMQNESFGEEGGAGLGLLEISRKSGSKLEYEMEDQEGKMAFHQQVTIRFDESNELPPQIQFTKMIEGWMKENNLSLIYFGALDGKSIQPVIDMMNGIDSESNWEDIDRLLKTLQSIQNNLFETDGHRGIIMLGENEGQKFVQVGLEVKHHEKESLCDIAKLQFKAQAWRSKHPFRPFAACVARPINAERDLFSFQMVP
jgi:hypothetical protein